ncbi:MAG TPA: hypothetical protein PLB32_04335 [Acidobacteriota bacterium]|nr:hypothetical protein [Acidobacteriota bacterium]
MMKFLWLIWFAAIAGIILPNAIGSQLVKAQSSTPELTDSQTDWMHPAKLEEALLKYDLTLLANQLAAKSLASDSPTELAFRIRVYIRAGHFSRLEQALPEIQRIKNYTDLFRDALTDLIDFGEIRLAQKLIELMPGLTPQTESVARFFDLMVENSSLQETDAWLAARVKLEPAWFEHHFDFVLHHGSVEPLLAQLRLNVEQHPEDWFRAYEYTDYARKAGRVDSFDWMATVCRPVLAVDCYRFATLVEGTAARRSFLEMALNRPFTPVDKDRMKSGYSIIPKDVDWEQLFEATVKKELAEGYLLDKQPEKAQQLMEEAARLTPRGIPLQDLGATAGMTQLVSGKRVIEQSILENEAAYRKEPQYWIERAHYYYGRDEYKLVDETIEKALAQFPLNKKNIENRNRQWIAYLSFWWLEKSESKGKMNPQLNRWIKEFESAPADHGYAIFLFRQLKPYLKDPDKYWVLPNGRMWHILALGSTWESNEPDEIEDQLKKARPDQQEVICLLLERIAKDGDVSKQYGVCAALCQAGLYKRAIPLLKRLMKTSPPGSGYAHRLLWDCYLNTGDWKSAEPLAVHFPKYIGLFERNLAALTVLAARNKELDEALRLWARKDNLNRLELTALPDLIRLGMGNHLLRYYQQMKLADPESVIPDKVLPLLQSNE